MLAWSRVLRFKRRNDEPSTSLQVLVRQLIFFDGRVLYGGQQAVRNLLPGLHEFPLSSIGGSDAGATNAGASKPIEVVLQCIWEAEEIPVVEDRGEFVTWEKVKEIAKRWSPTKFLTGLVLIHHLAQAVPWFLAIIGSSAVATYGTATQSPALLAISAVVGSASVITLLINFFVWYFQRRQTGHRREADNAKAKLGGQEIMVASAERMALALALIRDLNLTPLEILDPRRRDELTRDWLTRYLVPAMSKISHGVGVGLLEREWIKGREGEYRLRYDSGVPELLRSVLPKRSSRDFLTCLALLQLRIHHHHEIADEIDSRTKTWLIAFPTKAFDVAAEAVFSTGVRIVADAWGGSGPLPTAVPA